MSQAVQEDSRQEEPFEHKQPCTPLTIHRPIQLVTPPENFAIVAPRIYRCAFPKPNNFSYLSRLKLKSILCLVSDSYPPEHQEFLKINGIKFFQFGMPGNKEPFVVIPEEKVLAALLVILDDDNLPLLIHCNRGKHRTGCVVGVYRKLIQPRWALTTIFDEYRRFARPKERALDQQFIELFDENTVVQHFDPWIAPKMGIQSKSARKRKINV